MSEGIAVDSYLFKKFEIQVYDPFSDFLKGTPEEYRFTISLLDVVRFAGHACPAMIGAFLISQRATDELFPTTKVCFRGAVRVEIPAPVEQGATGPISNVFSFIFGAWDRSGFPGMQGRFVRRGLLSYDSPSVPQGMYRFSNLETGHAIDIGYDPSAVLIPEEKALKSFQEVWRFKIGQILLSPERYVHVRHVEGVLPRIDG